MALEPLRKKKKKKAEVRLPYSDGSPDGSNDELPGRSRF